MVRELDGAELTSAWGQGFSGRLRRGDLVFLNGPLGSGKTTLTQGIARGLGCDRAALSPTFVLRTDLGGEPPLVHVDAYRLRRPQEVADLDLEEALAEGVVVVEWPEMLEAAGMEPSWRLELEIIGPEKRRLTVKRRSPAGAGRPGGRRG